MVPIYIITHTRVTARLAYGLPTTCSGLNRTVLIPTSERTVPWFGTTVARRICTMHVVFRRTLEITNSDAKPPRGALTRASIAILWVLDARAVCRLR